jgi:hypothetical protein
MEGVLSVVLAQLNLGNVKLLDTFKSQILPWLIEYLESTNKDTDVVVKWLQLLIHHLSTPIPFIHHQIPWNNYSQLQQECLVHIITLIIDKLLSTTNSTQVVTLLNLAESMALLCGKMDKMTILASKICKSNLILFIPNSQSLLQVVLPFNSPIPCPAIQPIMMDACRALQNIPIESDVNLATITTLPQDQVSLAISCALLICMKRNDQITHTLLMVLKQIPIDDLPILKHPGVMEWLWTQTMAHPWSRESIYNITLSWIKQISQPIPPFHPIPCTDLLLEACMELTHLNQVCWVLRAISGMPVEQWTEIIVEHLTSKDRHHLAAWLRLLLECPIQLHPHEKRMEQWMEKQLQNALQQSHHQKVLDCANLLTIMDKPPTVAMQEVFAIFAEANLKRGTRVLMHLPPTHPIVYRVAHRLSSLCHDAFSVVPLMKLTENSEVLKKSAKEVWLATLSNQFLLLGNDDWIRLHTILRNRISPHSDTCRNSRMGKFAKMHDVSGSIHGPFVVTRCTFTPHPPFSEEYVVIRL